MTKLTDQQKQEVKLLIEERFEVLLKNDKTLETGCKTLDAKQTVLEKAIKALETKTTALEKKQTELEAEIKKLELKKKELEAKTTALEKKEQELEARASSTKGSWSSVLKGQKKLPEQIDLINVAAQENKERTIRENNIIIFGVPLSTKTDVQEKKIEDEGFIEGIFQQIGTEFNQVDKIIRLKVRDSSKPSPVLVKLKSDVLRTNILKSAKNLKGGAFDKVFIRPDLTEAQRSQLKMLVKERNDRNKDLQESSTFYYGIRNNKIVKITKPAS